MITAQLHDGRTLEFPDETPPEVVQATVKKVLGVKSDTSLLEKAKGYGEAGLSVASGLVAAPAGAAAGIARTLVSGKFGTQEGIQEGQEEAKRVSGILTYEPKTEAGKEALNAIGEAFASSKLAGLGPTEALAVSAIPVRPAVGMAGRVLRQGARDLKEKISPPREMVGVGSAQTEAEALRRARAADLPVPIKLTQGQATRDFSQQQFEREASKSPKVGEPLRQRYAEQNERILQNFDAWVDQTGAEAGSLRATGQTVTEALVSKSNKAKADIRTAYTKARESGAMQERVDVTPLQSYLDEHQAEAINAPVLTSVEARLSRVVKDGAVSINDLEEVRKMVGRLSGKDATNALFGREVKDIVDTMTEGKGGDLYKQARSLRSRYAQEFENHAVIDKLLSKKPGTQDRAVAYEDVFSHSILKGSLDDVRTVRKTLHTSGPQGQQAWKELQGATIQHIRDEITKNVQVDSAGNRVISPARLDRLVTELDKDGKLDFIFGKQGAQQIRDVNGIAQDAFTAPPGSVNTSNTASILMNLLDKVSGKTTGIPFVGSAVGYGVREIKEAGQRARVKKALE